MGRSEMVRARAGKLFQMNDIELVDTIVAYFDQNATMPGEKELKTYAAGLKNEFDGPVMTALSSYVRNELIESFASLCVKEVKLTNLQVVNSTKKNKDSGLLTASDLPMILTDTTQGSKNTVNNMYEFGASVSFADGVVSFTDKNGKDIVLASIPEGFRKNHASAASLHGTVIATDYSNGKFANMSYSMLVDFGGSLSLTA